VVPVDEYDKPVIDHLLEPDVMEGNKKTLHDFYQILKAADDHLQFVFLTGVSKFSGVSIFSGLNNINDITLDDRYASNGSDKPLTLKIKACKQIVCLHALTF
jgi:hypothetical protein